MSFSSWLRNWTSSLSRRWDGLEIRPTAARFRPRLEALEDRTLPSIYYAATVSDLIADINAANTAGGVNTITLTAPTTSPYVLTAVNNYTNGANGLPVISGGSKKVAADSLTILGNGDTIDGSKALRLFDVAKGGSLTLENLTLQNGFAYYGTGGTAEGGAVLNQGTLTLSGVAVQSNIAQGLQGGTTKKGFGTAGYDAAGGGIWSSGSLTVENQCVIQGNSALGGAGGHSTAASGGGRGPGGRAFGGGICIAGGTANITDSNIGTYYPLAHYGIGNRAVGGSGYDDSSNGGGAAYGGGVYVGSGTVTLNADSLEANSAQGGSFSGYGTVYGYGYGGGLYVDSGSVTLTNDTIDHNQAGALINGGTFVSVEYGYGGGIYIASGATVYLDSFTVTNSYANTASAWPWDIDGTYTLLS